jgi:hypothetical protein
MSVDRIDATPHAKAEALRLLETFVVDNPDLEHLETLLDQFNIFEALGVVRHEVRHSDFLAFLLSPQQSHGLADLFVKRLLQKALAAAAGSRVPVTPIELALWSLDGVIVVREWQNIDILLLDEDHQLAIIIENKISSGEHSGQLRRYRQIVAGHDPGWRAVGLYLTPHGDAPSDDIYLSVSYGLILDLVESVVGGRSSSLGADDRTKLVHYSRLLRRHIVVDSDIAELCRRIYQRHQRALDLIYEYRPDLQASLRDFVEDLVSADPRLVPDHNHKRYIRFAVRSWEVDALKQGVGWTPSGRMLLFEFDNSPTRLYLKLLIGPGPEAVRRRLFEQAKAHGHPFRPALSSLATQWNQIYSFSILTAGDLEERDLDTLKTKVRARWETFCAGDLESLIDAVSVMVSGLPNASPS